MVSFLSKPRGDPRGSEALINKLALHDEWLTLESKRQLSLYLHNGNWTLIFLFDTTTLSFFESRRNQLLNIFFFSLSFLLSN